MTRPTKADRGADLAQRREKALMVALHYASLGWAVTPGRHSHDEEKQLVCSKHPTVPWLQTEVDAGRIVGPTTDPREIREYWRGRGCDPFGADICIHAKPSRLVVVDCDRAWKEVVVEGDKGTRTSESRFVDGLAAFLDFMDGDVGTELVAASNRGVHFFYRVDSELAAKIGNRTGWFLGVDVRGGGESSGGVTIETNGVCPHRRWVRGTPSIEVTADKPEGEIVGLRPYPDIRFEADGTCIEGLPMLVDGRVEGIRPLPPKLLAALLDSSGAMRASNSTLRQRHQQAKAMRKKLQRMETSVAAHEQVDARGSSFLRPYVFRSLCECGACMNFEEAKDLLAWVPPEVGYEAWRNVLWALSDLLSGSKCGENLAAEWSEMSIIASRRDPAQARSIYRSDGRHLEVLLK